MYYHVSRTFLGKEKILTPLIPDCCTNTKFMCSAEEGNIPRICVSNSIMNCLVAICGGRLYSPEIIQKFKENPCVYISEKEAFIPPNASDFRQNNEHWYIAKTKFRYIGRVNIYQLTKRNVIIPTNEKEAKTIKRPRYIIETKVVEDFITRIVTGKFKIK
jgi:hypothetical protein